MRSVFVILIFLVSISCNKQKTTATIVEKGFTINGVVTNADDSVKLYLEDSETAKIIDSVSILKGKFQLKGKVKQPKKMTLKTSVNVGQEGYKYKTFWVDNVVISFKGDFNDFSYAKVEGLPLHEIVNKLSELTQPNYKKVNSLSSQYNEDDVNNRKIGKEVRRLMIMNDSITIQFVKDNPNNRASLSQMSYLSDKLTKEESQAIYNSLDKELKETDDGIVLKQFLEIEKIVEKGDQVAAITGKTLSGETKDLITIVKENKYTILDFWSSGCVPCRKQSKQYRKMYKIYKEKGLEIVSFSLDVKKELWEKASQEDSIPWTDISDLKGFKGLTPLTYGIKGIPNSFLINQEGEIVKEFMGFFPDKAPFQDDIAALFDKIDK